MPEASDTPNATRTSRPGPTKPDPRKRARRIRRALLGIFALALLGVIGFSFMPSPVPVDVGRCTRGDLRVVIDEDGRTRVKDRYVIAAPLSGNIARIELHPGDEVHAGDVLARIVPSTAPLLDERARAELAARIAAAAAAVRQSDATIARAHTALDLARAEASRSRSLAAQGSIATQALDRAVAEEQSRTEELASAEFGARIARHQLEMARAAAGRIESNRPGEDPQLELRSPISGRVLRVLQQSEGPVLPGTQILEIGDPAALEIVVDVLTSDAVSIGAGAHATVDRWGGARPLRAHVRTVEPSAFTRISSLGVEEQRVNVVLDLDEPHAIWSALGDGYRVEASIVVDERKDVVIVPDNAVFRHRGGWAVYAVRDGTAHLAPIRIGARNGLEVEVRGGLRAGETVIVSPGDTVRDGIRVAPR